MGGWGRLLQPGFLHLLRQSGGWGRTAAARREREVERERESEGCSRARLGVRGERRRGTAGGEPRRGAEANRTGGNYAPSRAQAARLRFASVHTERVSVVLALNGFAAAKMNIPDLIYPAMTVVRNKFNSTPTPVSSE